jgi:peroxiredoxin
MRRVGKTLAFAAGLAMLAAAPAGAELKAGTKAPSFETQASLGGRVFDFKLSAALKRGPVVLYFYPAAFTPGCTIEAHDFAEHIGDYKDLGATVIGVSVDPIAKLRKFSVSACRSKFAVASDARAAISKAYDAVLGAGPAVFSNRTSYVIAKDGTIFYAYTALDPGAHVRNTLGALRKLRSRG